MLRIALVIVALLSGGAAGLLSWRAVEARSAPPSRIVATAPAITVEVLTLARDVAPGEAVAAQDLVWRDWPRDAAAERLVERGARPDAASELAGRRARTALLAGEPVFEARLLAPDVNLLAAMLGEGERAVAVRVSAESAAGGFVLPGDRVDVLHFSEEVGARRSQIILRNVEILAIDQTANDEAREAVVGKTATLRVTLEQAELVLAAEASGRLSLALRSLADSTGGTAAEAPPAPVVEAAAPEALEIRVRRAGELETVVLR